MGAGTLVPAPISRLLFLGYRLLVTVYWLTVIWLTVIVYCSKRSSAHTRRGGDGGQEGGEGGY